MMDSYTLWARCLIFGLSFHLDPNYVCEALLTPTICVRVAKALVRLHIHLLRLVWAFAACISNKNQSLMNLLKAVFMFCLFFGLILNIPANNFSSNRSQIQIWLATYCATRTRIIQRTLFLIPFSDQWDCL